MQQNSTSSSLLPAYCCQQTRILSIRCLNIWSIYVWQVEWWYKITSTLRACVLAWACGCAWVGRWVGGRVREYVRACLRTCVRSCVRVTRKTTRHLIVWASFDHKDFIMSLVFVSIPIQFLIFEIRPAKCFPILVISLRWALYNTFPLIGFVRTYFLDINKLGNYHQTCTIKLALRKIPA